MSHEVRCAASLCALAAISAGAWLVLLVVAELLLGGGVWLVVLAPLSLVGLVASIRVLFTGVDVHASSVVVRNVWRTYTIADEDLRSASIEPSSNWVVSLFAFNCRYTGPDRVRLELRDGAQVDVFVLATTELWRDGDLSFHRSRRSVAPSACTPLACSRVEVRPRPSRFRRRSWQAPNGPLTGRRRCRRRAGGRGRP